jgi:signal peptidase I
VLTFSPYLLLSTKKQKLYIDFEDLMDMQLKRFFKKLWYFIWNDDSVWSWIVNIALAYILIKFIVYPVLGFTLATTHPIVAVVSGSMEHEGKFNDWWNSPAICDGQSCSQAEYYNQIEISQEEFKEFQFSNGFNRGDIMVLYGTKPDKLNVGDVLVFKSKRPDPIIHRIIKKEFKDGRYVFQTKGDHNAKSISTGSLDEIGISELQLVGEAVMRIPYLGFIKIWFVEFVNLFG